jgi:RNA 3'-terminal phosphate cyclase (ATP)
VSPRPASRDRVELDGSHGEGGGQILRTALTLSLLTGRPFRIRRIRANRDKPGLRPQHLAAVRAAATLGLATVRGDEVGSSDLTFEPSPYEARDLAIDIGTAGATALVLQTLFLPLALRTTEGVRLSLTGGTFNTKAPSFPFLDRTWRPLMAAAGLPLALSMPSAGFYPRGGGRLEAWIEPGKPRGLRLVDRGRLRRLSIVAGTAHLAGRDIPARMIASARSLLEAGGVDPALIDSAEVEWPAASPGAAISLVAEHEGMIAPATFVGLGERGKPAEAVASEAVAEMLTFLAVDAPIDPHSADQLLLPLSLAAEASEYLVTEATEHLRTNAATIRSFLDRRIVVDESGDGPARVLIG